MERIKVREIKQPTVDDIINRSKPIKHKSKLQKACRDCGVGYIW